jgi:hypothetical protein
MKKERGVQTPKVVVLGAGSLFFGRQAIWQMVAHLRWQEVVNVVAGGWLILSPFIYQYAGALAWWHFILGVLVVLLAIHELWQESRKPEAGT